MRAIIFFYEEEDFKKGRTSSFKKKVKKLLPKTLEHNFFTLSPLQSSAGRSTVQLHLKGDVSQLIKK